MYTGSIAGPIVALGALSVYSALEYTRASCAEEEPNRVLTKNFVADAAALAAPSVVNISSVSGGGIFMTGSAGSGFIISEDGYVVTNAHVVPDVPGADVVVTLSDFRKFAGKVHSVDAASDIAIIKMNVPGEVFPVALLGSSGDLRPGEFVIAMGSPLQLQNSVSFGIVSATARHGSEIGAKHRSDYLQTDAAINVGNSGGPLLNINAEVVGINNMKAQGVDGISFAIPIDTANQVIPQLLEHKVVVRPYIGMNMINYYPSRRGSGKDRNLPSAFRVGDTYVQVADVTPGSPADVAGLERGDIVVGVNGKKVLNGIPDVLGCIGLDIGKVIVFDVKGKSGVERQVRVTTTAEQPYHKTGSRRRKS
jgi:HtrA serine peptidase 2